jgi:hypothetical protein
LASRLIPRLLRTSAGATSPVELSGGVSDQRGAGNVGTTTQGLSAHTGLERHVEQSQQLLAGLGNVSILNRYLRGLARSHSVH